MQCTCVRRIGIIVLIAGSLFASYGLGVTAASAAPPVKDDPLAGVTQNWDKNLPSDTRFTVLANFGGAAVRDNNTGLVWEQAPDVTLQDWFRATNDCVKKAVGGTFGWRLPSVVELKSLQDPSLPAPFVPNNVFSNVQNIQVPIFWSATTNWVHPELAWLVIFVNDEVGNGLKTGGRNVWCVRGPMNADVY